MALDSELRDQVRKIGGLVEEIEAISDPAVRANTRELLQSVMDLHRAALERVLEIVSGARESGMDLIDELGRDSLVSCVLVLYGLHPEDMDSRVRNAIEQIKPKLRKQGCEVDLIELNEGAVRVRARMAEHTCGSTAKTVHSAVEAAIYDAAPDIDSLIIEGLDGQPASGFVALDKLIGVAEPQDIVL